MSRRDWTRDLALITGVLVVAALWLLNRPPVWEHGEAREGLVVQDIVRHGHWVLPSRNGELPSKPPLFHWTAAAVAEVAGLSDFTLRCPSMLGAWLMAVATFVLGVRVGGRATGWLAVGALAGLEAFWGSASEARTDMLFSGCLTLALAAFLLWYLDGRRAARAVCYVAVALAVLAKGPAGAALVGLVIVGFLAAQRELGRLRDFWSWPLVLAAALVVVAWYGAATLAGGREFVALQLLRENVDRFVGQGQFHRSRRHGVLRMEGVLLTHLLPWNLVLGWALVRRWRGEREDAAGRFLHAWWIAILAFFTIAAGKRGVYLLPLYPAIALLAARALGANLDDDRLLGVLPVPARLRRRARPALGLLATLIVAFDLTLVAASQLAREQRARERSLLPFLATVSARVGPTGQLRATPELDGTDLQVIAYRLGQPIARAPLACEDAAVHFLAPGEPPPAAGTVVAVSRRRGNPVALVACAGTRPAPGPAAGPAAGPRRGARRGD